MLFLSRRRNESIVIRCDGRKIVMTVEEITSGRARLVFSADPDVEINRIEIDALKRPSDYRDSRPA